MCKKYRPSNGTEGMIFVDEYCSHCIHEKFMHTQVHGDLQCEIFDKTLIYDVKDKEYPEEWTYDENGHGICTKFKKFDWGRDDDGEWKDPPPPPTDDPNQLVIPFIFDELEIKSPTHELEIKI